MTGYNADQSGRVLQKKYACTSCHRVHGMKYNFIFTIATSYSQLAAYVESKLSLGTSLSNSFNHLTFWPAAQTFLKVIQNSTEK